MRYNRDQWIGNWENFERYFSDASAAMQKTWQEAEDAFRMKKQNLVEKALFRHGVKRFWQDACYTVTKENPRQLGGWSIQPEGGENMQITWYAMDGETLGTYVYALEQTIEKGLEGKTSYLFHADAAGADCPFTYLMSMEPMPQKDAKLHGGLISHLHFQYASKKESLLDRKGGLKQKHWYATMCDGDASQLQRCNIVRAMHKLPLWDEMSNE